MSDVAPITGVFYEQKILQMGTAGTHKVTQDHHDLHYFVKENAKGEVDICILKPDGTPTSMVVETVEKEAFFKRFKDCTTHECEFRKKSPEEKKAALAEEKARVGQQHLEKKEYNAATFEFGQALKADKDHLEAHLGKGQAHLALGEVDKAKEHFEQMAKIDKLYDEGHKHTFNELGITLRRTGLYEEAMRNYAKAAEIDPNDEALYFNIAVACKEWGKPVDAKQALEKALALKPDFAEAKALLATLK